MEEMTPEQEWRERLRLRALDPEAAKEDALLEAIRARAMNEVYWPRAALTILPKDLPQFYRFVADRIGSERTIDYLEFGVAHGNSIRTMAGMFTAQATKFYGFDSFLGLPERWFVAEVGAFRR
ncbi:MAG: hypothetical protein QOH05_995 [Acetobacteraceae bacterium]|jgi:O-methyltransferase|nr:hypothetical protein [Acetobacteraceae bacterium]